MFPNGYRSNARRNQWGWHVRRLLQSSEKWIGNPRNGAETAVNGATRELEILGMVNLCHRRLASVVYASIPGVWFRNRTGVQMAKSALAMARP